MWDWEKEEEEEGEKKEAEKKRTADNSSNISDDDLWNKPANHQIRHKAQGQSIWWLHMATLIFIKRFLYLHKGNIHMPP